MDPNDSYSTISEELERTCALEPIHLLGTVQSYGFLMVIDVASRSIVQVSEGILRHWPGLQDAGTLLGAPLADWVAATHESHPLAIDTLPSSGPVILPWRMRLEQTGDDAAHPPSRWECLGHRCGDLALLEWLPVESPAEGAPPHNGMFDALAEVISRLRHAERLDAFFDDCAQVVQAYTRFDRVMIYRFMADGCGDVVAERTSQRCQPKYLGLRFPASDIPAQARRLYLINRLRVLADVHAPVDALVPPTLPDGGALDQSHCMLRGMSEVHRSYLHNMDVRATLTVSLVCDGKLWGLIACHHQEPKTPPHQIREAVRQVCELLAEVANMRIEALSNLDAMGRRMELDGLLNQFHQALVLDGRIGDVVELWLPKLLQAFNASTLGLRIGTFDYVGGEGIRRRNTSRILDEVATLVDTQNQRPAAFTWDALHAGGKPGLASLPDAAGLLLAQRYEERMSFCFLGRPEMVQQVRWGGEPTKQDLVTLPDGRIRLEPRRSFAEWQQTVRGHSAPWSQPDAEALQSLLRILSDAQKMHLNRELQQTLHWRAHHDHLTGLHNRMAMEDALARRLAHGQFDCALMLLDLDHFKKINDTYGHDTGDQVLQQLSLRLKAVTREFDLLARLGGDEFIVVPQIPHPSPATALTFAERLHQTLAAPFDVGGQQLRLAISVGIAIPPGHGRTVTDLLKHADLALYHAKSRGRARSAVFELAMASEHLDYFLLERDLSEAVERNQFSLVYQPKFDLRTRKVVGLEALLRWNHPTRGQNSPAVFIAIAERSDEITRIDRWVMRRAIADRARWQREGMPQLPIAINLSLADILSPNLTTYVAELLQEYEVSPDALEIELTESCIMSELARTQDVLQALNELGIHTTLDDFGTGYSSLSYLRQLPLQCLKIDQSFVQSMLEDPNAEKLTQAIIAMGVALEMHIVGEGVETKEQMNWLLAKGCHIGQGYFFSPPVPSADVHSVIERLELRLAS
jgi:diguanylate cyclase (GGDEF)-like protein